MTTTASVMEGTPFGRYRMIELLGRGGMGEVWRAFDTVTERVVAVKVLPAHLASDPQFEQRFRREAFAAAGLNDPHVVPIHHFGEIEGRLYVDMRLIEGRDLQTVLGEDPLDAARAVLIVEQVAFALDAAHRVGLVHRDVKPSNILLAEHDFAYLIDFGIARGAGDTGMTGTGNVIGTWPYMAPERFTTGRTDSRADVYALACVLYECLTRSRPFSGNSVEQQIAGHLTSPPPRPSITRPGVPPQLDAVIARGMAKDPDERYATTLELARAARAASTAPTTRPQPMPPTRPVHHAGRPSWPGVAQSDQAWTTRGVSPLAPTQHRPHPNLWGQAPHGDGQTAPTKSSGKKRAAIFGAIAVIAVLAVVAVIVVSNRGDSSPAASETSTSQTPTAVPNTGPFTGTFTADFGPQLRSSGTPVEGAPPPYQETWRLRSVCGASGCVATATTGGRYPAKEVIFDDVGGTWLAVITSQDKCGGIDDERFDVISLQQRPDGTLSGEWTTTYSLACFSKRTVTFTRTGDTDIDLLTDPASQPPRVVSPAEALHGQYHKEKNWADGAFQQSDYRVRTDCLRTGDRCISDVADSDGAGFELVFANGKWTRISEYDFTCSGSGASHIKQSAEFPLPQPSQDPITLLAGHGRAEVTGGACTGGDYDEKFVRTGD